MRSASTITAFAAPSLGVTDHPGKQLVEGGRLWQARALTQKASLVDEPVA